MKRSRAIMMLWGLTACLMLTAKPLTKETACQKALQFLSEKRGGHAAARSVQRVELTLGAGVATDQLYVFNVGDSEGFVVVSGDDCTGDAVLGYADEGAVTAGDMPDNLRAWLQGYAEQIRWMQAKDVRNEASAARSLRNNAVRKPISALLSTKWNQNEPYNDNCPEVLVKINGYDTNYRAVTGCVATAAAQVMYWHQLNAGIDSTVTKTIPAYKSDIAPIIKWTDSQHIRYEKTNMVERKAATTIYWTKLKDSYTSSSPAEDKAAIAQLMEYVGAGVRMSYGYTSMSYSTDVPSMMIQYFGYNKSARNVKRNDYYYGDWVDLLYNQIAQVGPVFYSAQSTGGGHAFVLDGYSEDDFFHVNWGWGGSGNGYFKLSVLKSDVQGIGGSSSQDGYNYDQDAIIDVNPIGNDEDESSMRMTVQKAWIESSLTWNRDTTTVNFPPFDVFFEIRNNTYQVGKYVVGWGLFKDGALKQLLASYETEDLSVSWGFANMAMTVQFGAGLDDGEYKMIPICRKAGLETWYYCFGSNQNYFLATINGTALEIKPMTHELPQLTGQIDVSDTIRAGSYVTVTAHVKNKGRKYSADLTLNQYDEAQPNGLQYKVLCAQQTDIETADSVDVAFRFVAPQTAGDCVLRLLDYTNQVVAAKKVTIVPDSVTTGVLSIDWENAYTMKGGDFYKGVCGPKLEGTVRITNMSYTADHTSGVIVRLYEAQEGSDSYMYFGEYISNDTIEKNSSKEIPFEFNGLQRGNSYFFNVFYKVNNEFIAYSYVFKNNGGVTLYMADGTEKTVAPTNQFSVDNNVLAVDISNAPEVRWVIPNSNPNTLYFVGDVVPAGLIDKANVVMNGMADFLVLSDHSPFYAPMEFKAKKAFYTRTFDTGTDGYKGWSTIVLPFDVTTVKQGETVVDWFHHSNDTAKYFWLKELVSEGDSIVYFNYADRMEACIPYIIAVAGSKWGDRWSLVDKELTFIGENTTVKASSLTSVSTFGYRFIGALQEKALTDSYLMNADGTAFVKSSSMIAPFRAYFQPLRQQEKLIGTLAFDTLALEIDAVGDVLRDRNAGHDAIYRLNGQRVSQPGKGIIIRNGKKWLNK